MSSVIFQPLLHDSLGWKTSNSTYADSYKWKKDRSSNKDKRISTYGQQYQKELQKQQKLQQTNASLPPVTNEGQTIQRIVLVKKNDDQRRSTSSSHRYSPSKTPPAVTEEPPAFIVEYKQRPASINREATSGSRASQRSPPAAEETIRPVTALDAQRSSKEEKEKVITDLNNDSNHHWLTFTYPKTPQYLIDIKQRLGQLKVPSSLVRPTSAANVLVDQPESSDSQRQQQQPPPPKSADQRHLFDFNLPETPNELRASRHRLEKHRYNSSLDNYPPRPKTCPVQRNDNSKPLTPLIASESETEPLPPIQTTKDDVWTDNDEENKTTDDEASSIAVEIIDVDSLPNEYVEAIEIANAAQEEYLKNSKNNHEKKPENFVYRLPSISSDKKSESIIAYHNQQQSTPTPNNHSTSRNHFGTWIRNATDKERESAMKILNDVLQKPIMGYDPPIQQQVSRPSSKRRDSASRKLGRTRTPHQRIPCEICEKQLIKNHVWNLTQSETLTCSHQAQGIKPPSIQVRT